MSCATSWAVVKLWQPLEKPTLAQDEALSSWTMSSAVGTKAPFCSALISAGMPTTVTTARMPVFCAGCCDLQTTSSRNLLWPAPLPPGSLPPVTTAVHSALPSPCLGESLPKWCGPAWDSLALSHQLLWTQFNESSHFLLSQNRKVGKILIPKLLTLSLVGLQVQHP